MSRVASLLIRPMEETDIGPLAGVLGWPARGIERRWQESAQGLRAMLVAEADGKPVGSVSINQHADFAGLLHLFALDVAPSRQRRGIGSRLIRAVGAEARAQGLHGVYLEVNVQNRDALRLYERLGYRREGGTFVNKWLDYREDGAPQEVSEVCHRLFKRFGTGQR